MKKILIVFLMSLVAMVAAGQEADTLSINKELRTTISLFNFLKILDGGIR